MKMALINLDKELNLLGYGRIVMNIHDEVVVECPNQYAEEMAKKVQSIVGAALGYFLKTIEGKASVKVSAHWEK